MDLKACDVCGPAAQREILSAHSTSVGLVIYLRCACGSVGVRLIAYEGAWRES
ncbi:hypothetical protein ABZ860_03595 [Microbispora sp. NPDC046973]|uniref:hypothetical protein n=1 Tax=Microbispora sp. NPDC046973 TaxID=3155022 RepID=UPI0033EA9470